MNINTSDILDAIDMTVVKPSIYSDAKQAARYERERAHNRKAILRFLENVDDNLSVFELREALEQVNSDADD